MKSNKGFTLIELLAVIVILAIIALIATPIIIGVIDQARKKAFENTSYGVLDGLRLDYTERILTGNTGEEKIFTFPNSGLKLSGEEPAYGEAKIDSKGNISFALADKDKRWCTKKEANSEKVTIEDYTEENCKIDGTSGGGEVTPPESFEADSWETIAANVKVGNLSKYKVGDEKEVTLTGDYAGTYTVRIVNTSKPTECGSSDFSQSSCGFVVEFVDIITEARMNPGTDENPYGTNVGGWPSSEMYSLVNTTIYNSLPLDLKNVIIDTDILSSHGPVETVNFKSTDKLYLLATKEVWGKEGTSNQIDFDTSDANTRQLDYYKNEGVTTVNYSGAIKQYQGSNNRWWLRSAYYSDSARFYRAMSNGAWRDNVAYDVGGVSPAFRIG